jgi:hypothetical protein
MKPFIKKTQNQLPLNQCYRRYLKESYTQKKKINAIAKIEERTNLTR